MAQSLTAKQQYWTEVLESADSSGVPLVEFARANQLNPKVLYRWRNQLKKYVEPHDQQPTQFTQVVVTVVLSVTFANMTKRDLRSTSVAIQLLLVPII